MHTKNKFSSYNREIWHILDFLYVIYKITYIVLKSLYVERTVLRPWYWNLLLNGLISGKNSALFQQLLPIIIRHVSFHQVPITAGWTEAAWNNDDTTTTATEPNPQTSWRKCVMKERRDEKVINVRFVDLLMNFQLA